MDFSFDWASGCSFARSGFGAANLFGTSEVGTFDASHEWAGGSRTNAPHAGIRTPCSKQAALAAVRRLDSRMAAVTPIRLRPDRTLRERGYRPTVLSKFRDASTPMCLERGADDVPCDPPLRGPGCGAHHRAPASESHRCADGG